VAVLNTLVQADTSSFDRGMDKAEQRTGQFSQAVKSSSGVVEGTFKSLGANSLVSLAQLGPVVDVVASKLGAAWQAGQQFFSILTAGARIGSTMFSSLIGIAGSVVKSLFGGIVSGITSGFATVVTAVGGTVGSALLAVLGTIGSVASIFGGVFIGAIAAAGGALGVVTGGLLALVAAGTGATITLSHFATEGAHSIATLSTLAKEIGFNVHAFSALANTAGLNPEGFTHSVLHMERAISDGGAGVTRALDAMGLALADLQDLAPIQQLEKIYESFRNIETQGQKASVAMQLFGRSGIQMLDSLSRGPEGLERARAQAERFGLTFTEVEASLVRRSLKAWGQWSLAMEGVSRKLAVIFAPVWESLGNLFGNIGERLVRIFADREVVQAVHGVWRAIADAGKSAWDYVAGAVSNFWNTTRGLSSINSESIKSLFIELAIGAEYTFQNIGPLARHAWNEVKLGALELADVITLALNRAIMAVDNALFGVASRFNQFATGFNSMMERFNSGRGKIDFWQVSPIGPIDRSGLGRLLDETREAVDRGRQDIFDSYNVFRENRLSEIREAAAIFGDATDHTLAEAGRSAQAGRRVQSSGGSPLEANSAEWFSIFNGRQADVAALTREHVEIARRTEQVMRDLLVEDRDRPSIAVARY
jgi:hypothetical protein